MTSRPEAYTFIDEQLALVGTDSPIDILSSTPDELEKLVRSVPSEVLLSRPFPGKWRPLDIVAHLADMEWVYGYRIRHILCDSSPVLTDLDQDLWVERQVEHNRTAQELLDQFRTTREVNVGFWSRLSAEQLHRSAYHPGADREYSLEFMLRLHAGHDRRHLAQMGRWLGLD